MTIRIKKLKQEVELLKQETIDCWSIEQNTREIASIEKLIELLEK